MKNSLYQTLERIQARQSGATLHKYESVHYSSGYQFSRTANSETNTAPDIKTAAALVESLGGSCGIWYYGGLFYIETSYHTDSLISAGLEAWKHDQISVYDWANDSYIQIHKG